MSFCKDCVTGAIHEGTPVGRVEKFDGVDVYVSLPDQEYPKDKALLFLSDIFGLPLPNAKLLTDSFAKNGFQTYLIDYLNGDAAPAAAMATGAFDVGKWFPNHGSAQTRPPLDKVIAALKAKGIREFAATGYCFGAKYVFELAQENVIKVGAVAHPSLLDNPGDIEKLLKESKAPMLINSCETDAQFPAEFQKVTDELLGDGKYAPGYKRTYYPGATHGFGVRADLSDEKEKFAKEEAFKETCRWVAKYL
jgi:dienelactone hydrolase